MNTENGPVVMLVSASIRSVSRRSAWTAGLMACLVAVVGTSALAAAQSANPPWPAPEPATQVKNPVTVTPEGLATAQKLFEVNCSTCHGPNGAGDGPAAGVLTRKAFDFTDANVMRTITDGELFWKMSAGRPPMPPWQDLLSETERWELVNYLRTLAPQTPAADPAVNPGP
jgi:mono/diheme cytochrome c family protein